MSQHQGNLYVDSKKRTVILHRLSIRGISVDSQKEESHYAVPQHQGNLYVDSAKEESHSASPQHQGILYVDSANDESHSAVPQHQRTLYVESANGKAFYGASASGDSLR